MTGAHPTLCGRPAALRKAAGLPAFLYWRKTMKLQDNPLQLIQHLARFNLLDYAGCLKMLDVDETGDRTALSYAFRPLTKNKYLSKRKDGSVSILAKGRALFPEVKPLIAAGGGASETRRVIEISRMAALMEKTECLLLGVSKHPRSRVLSLPPVGGASPPASCPPPASPGYWQRGSTVWWSITSGMGPWTGRHGRRVRCFTRNMAAMRQKPRGCE